MEVELRGNQTGQTVRSALHEERVLLEVTGQWAPLPHWAASTTPQASITTMASDVKKWGEGSLNAEPTCVESCFWEQQTQSTRLPLTWQRQMDSSEKWEVRLPANNYAIGKTRPVFSVSRIHSTRNKNPCSSLYSGHIKVWVSQASARLPSLFCCFTYVEGSSASRRHTLISG